MPPDPLLLQRIAARGWRAESSCETGGWLLRANRGWTGRANSALPLSPRPGGEAGGTLEDALSPVRDFFSRHGLPMRVQVPLPACRSLDEELGRRGFVVTGPTRVLVANVAADGRSDAAPWDVEISGRPDDEWLAACERWGRSLGGFGGELLGRHPRAGFAAVRGDGGRMVAIGRVVVDDGWAGLSTAAVRPDHRRRGLATTLARARLRWARSEHGAARAYTQVEKDNTPSLAVCRKVGFVPHHDYHYRDEPS